MPKNFTESDIAQMCELIESWPYKKMTWKQICESSEAILGFVPTRQGLEKYSAIYEAYSKRKKRASEETKRIPSLTKLLNSNTKLNNEIEDLEEQKKAILAAIKTIEFKAKEILNLSDRTLRMPMPKIDRSVLSNRTQAYKNR